MIKSTLNTIAKQLNVTCADLEVAFSGVSIDSREIQPGELFVAIKGEHFDGHEFIEQAKEKGAVAVLVSKTTTVDLPQLRVDDTIIALGLIAKFWREQFKIPLIAITGSNGKTTVRHMLCSIAKEVFKEEECLESLHNFNNHIGLPLSLLRLSSTHKIAVVELAMNHLGEIRYLTKIAQPTVGVITNACASHLMGVGDEIQGVVQAKGELLEEMKKGSTVVLNRDNEFFDCWEYLAKDKKIITFGLSTTADVSAQQIKLQDNASLFELVINDKTAIIDLPVPGEHNVMNALAAAACTQAIKIDISSIQKGLGKAQLPKRRTHQFTLSNDTTIIDDSYNANPASTMAAIDVLKKRVGTKILVFADMKELGKHEKDFHQDIGAYAKESKIDYLLGFGDLAEETVKIFGTNATHFKTQEELLIALKPMLNENTVVLIKGSNSMKLDQLVSKLLKSVV